MASPALIALLTQVTNWVLVGGFVVMMVAELALPLPRIPWTKRFRHIGGNLMLWLIGVALSSWLFGLSFLYVQQLFAAKHVGLLRQFNLSPGIAAALGFLALDFSEYTFHRLSHRVRWVWLLHAVHHSDPSVDISTNLRQHPLHVLSTILWKFVVTAAFGVPLWVLLVRDALTISLSHAHHVAIRWPRFVDSSLGWLIVTPRAHLIHHSPLDAETNANFGPLLSVWDRLFGTYVSPLPIREATFGLRSLDGAAFQTVWGMLVTPLRARSYERF